MRFLWLEASSAAPGNGPAARRHSAADIVWLAKTITRANRHREAHLPKCARPDTAWNMILDLYCNHADGRPTSVSSACIASGAPPTTALRHIAALVDEGLVIRLPDPTDGRRVFVRLAPKLRDDVSACLTDMLQQIDKSPVWAGGAMPFRS